MEEVQVVKSLKKKKSMQPAKKEKEYDCLLPQFCDAEEEPNILVPPPSEHESFEFGFGLCGLPFFESQQKAVLKNADAVLKQRQQEAPTPDLTATTITPATSDILTSFAEITSSSDITASVSLDAALLSGSEETRKKDLSPSKCSTKGTCPNQKHDVKASRRRIQKRPGRKFYSKNYRETMKRRLRDLTEENQLLKVTLETGNRRIQHLEGKLEGLTEQLNRFLLPVQFLNQNSPIPGVLVSTTIQPQSGPTANPQIQVCITPMPNIQFQ